jgi:hypothetical protein
MKTRRKKGKRTQTKPHRHRKVKGKGLNPKWKKRARNALVLAGLIAAGVKAKQEAHHVKEGAKAVTDIYTLIRNATDPKKAIYPKHE